MVNVSVPDDYLVEGNELFNVVIESFKMSPVSVYIIDNDCKIFPFAVFGILKWIIFSCI